MPAPIVIPSGSVVRAYARSMEFHPALQDGITTAVEVLYPEQIKTRTVTHAHAGHGLIVIAL